MHIKKASQYHMCTLYIHVHKNGTSISTYTISEHSKDCTNAIATEVQATATRLFHGVLAFIVKADIKLLSSHVMDLPLP